MLSTESRADQAHPAPEDRPLPLTPPLPSIRLLGAAALLPALVAGVVTALVLGPTAGAVYVLFGVASFAIVGGAVASWVWRRSARPDAIGLSGRRADRTADARLVNVVEGLCASAGVRFPDLRIVESEGRNLAAGGRDASRACLVVTSGLLEGLSRVELEGILAGGVMAIRRGAVAGPSIAAVTGINVKVAVGAGRDILVDAAAVRLTRYPPGLCSALQRLADGGTVVAGVPRRAAHLWLADPLDEPRLPSYRRPLPERIDALSEL